MKEPAHNLKDTPFPDCGSRCLAVEYLGVGECESVCPWKFNKDGEPTKKQKRKGDGWTDWEEFYEDQEVTS